MSLLAASVYSRFIHDLSTEVKNIRLQSELQSKYLEFSKQYFNYYLMQSLLWTVASVFFGAQ